MKLEEELKVKKFESHYQKAGLSIMFTSAWLEDQINSLLKEYDISEQQYNVLRILKGQKDQPLNLMDIQERMIHKMSNATRLVEKLRLKGLVEREVCEDNRRKVEIRITNTGLELVDKLIPKMKKLHTKVFDNISKKEAKQLATLLDKLRS